MDMPVHRRSEAGITRVDTLLLAGTGLLLLMLAGVPGQEDPQAALSQARVTIDSAFDLARALSQSTGAPHGVVIDPDGDRLAVIDSKGRLARVPEGAETLVDLAALGIDVELVDFGPGGHTAIYDGAGVPLSEGRITLQCAGRRLDLRLDGATGWIDAQSE